MRHKSLLLLLLLFISCGRTGCITIHAEAVHDHTSLLLHPFVDDLWSCTSEFSPLRICNNLNTNRKSLL